jgi:hypothetical protein
MKVPGVETPKQNSEGESVLEGQEDEIFDSELQAASLNAKKTNPYGPAFSELNRIFKTGR